jgi:prevent-host-death family protein
MAMKRVKIAELKDRLSEHLRAVEKGAEVEVTDRNRPIARIVPVPNAGRRIRIIEPTRHFSSVRGRRYRAANWTVDSTRLLIEERGER